MWLGEQKLTSALIPVPRFAEEWMLFEIDAVVNDALLGRLYVITNYFAARSWTIRTN